MLDPTKSVKPDGEAGAMFELAGGSCFAFHSTDPDCFIVGTEEGKIHKCSKAYNSQYLLSFEVCLRISAFCIFILL